MNAKKKPKRFLAQLVIEIEPQFSAMTEAEAADYIRKHIKLDSRGHIADLNLYALADNPPPQPVVHKPVGMKRDWVVEQYEYQDFFVIVCQEANNLNSTGTQFFGVAKKKTAKTGGVVVKGSDSNDLERTKAAVESYIDKRMTWRR